jgi:hypothetical protein
MVTVTENVFIDNCITNDISLNKNKTTKIKKPKVKEESKEINYINFNKNVINLKSFKLLELKQAAKKHKLHVTGTKPVIIERLEYFFKNTNQSIKIQAFFRGHLVRVSFKLRGPALKNRKLCVNETDFISMEPLEEIASNCFFSFEDDKNFIYGFNIKSLIQLIQSKTKLENPYNREKFTDAVYSNIIALYKINCIIYPGFNQDDVSSFQTPTTTQNRNLQRTNRSMQSHRAVVAQTTEMRELLNRLTECRAKPIQQRITELFMEIDLLGNYTQSIWLSNLNITQYIRLYRALYDIWFYRSNMSIDTKINIYPLGSPFEGIFPRNVYHNEINFNQIQSACTTVIENLVYSGVDDDHKRLGCFHALSAITLVCSGARETLPWLYESVAY